MVGCRCMLCCPVSKENRPVVQRQAVGGIHVYIYINLLDGIKVCSSTVLPSEREVLAASLPDRRQG
jgi:hypothetical protein